MSYPPEPGIPATHIPRRIERNRAALLIIDLQGRLLPAVQDPDHLVRHVTTLARCAEILNVPVAATEQYRKGLGPTDATVAAAIKNFTPIDKLTFSGCVEPILGELRGRARRDIILCGVETHVCVTQTALDLLDAGFRTFVVSDACSSRTRENWQIGLERMQAAGAILVSVEMIVFELLGCAGTEEFKRVLPEIK
jgi:nicotinamidase-related amidase